ncbi:hypothetical protein P5673_012373 [Acropora cervicornis]|uniref:Uncharacterized protein n=1 Tax=Acropora cervicornis TaxID=6130 RepID=A0AAD9V7G6_ACRCE|nr:hypothetical protein P5673_012373 [Acropora cervicornis]
MCKKNSYYRAYKREHNALPLDNLEQLRFYQDLCLVPSLNSSLLRYLTIRKSIDGGIKESSSCALLFCFAVLSLYMCYYFGRKLHLERTVRLTT